MTLFMSGSGYTNIQSLHKLKQFLRFLHLHLKKVANVSLLLILHLNRLLLDSQSSEDDPHLLHVGVTHQVVESEAVLHTTVNHHLLHISHIGSISQVPELLLAERTLVDVGHALVLLEEGQTELDHVLHLGQDTIEVVGGGEVLHEVLLVSVVVVLVWTHVLHVVILEL